MADKKSGILVCQVTRRNMQISFIWPNFKEELNPGKWYYFKITIFLLGFSVIPASVAIHLIVTLKDDLDLHIIEDIALLTSMIGIGYMAVLYVRNQPRIAQLLLDLSSFPYNKPPNFDNLNKRLNFWSWFASMYPTCGLSIYSTLKLALKSQCQKMNLELGLDEKCGLLQPLWIPFDIDYFPVFHLILAYTWISGILFFRLHLSIFFQALEISLHVLLRIEHLSTMIESCFDDVDGGVRRQQLIRCVKYHQKILGMVERLDLCFSDLMFVHFVMTASICGCLEKQCVDGIYPLTAVIHLAGWIMSLFIASLGGQKIIEAGTRLSKAVWSSKWYLADSVLQKDVLFVVAKCQRGLHTTVGSFGILSYQFFLVVLKMSYSVLAVLTS